MADLFLSGPFDFKGKGWGYAHYSYGFAMESFMDIAKDTDNILNTFSYPFNVGIVKASVRKSKNPVSISFLPPDVSLFAPNSKNICVFAWEFDKLPPKSAGTNGIFKKDYERMLKRYDSVITLSSYSKKTLGNYGIKAHVLPSAVSKKIVEPDETIKDIPCHHFTTVPNAYDDNPGMPLQDILDNSEYEQRFLYVFNPNDIRKNFGNLVTAFTRFTEEYPNAVLILKMTAKSTLAKLQEIAFKREFPSFPNTNFNNVYVIADRLSDSKLQMLMDSCQNYVSPTRAEGQNLPLCEAMISGMLCISPDHTSMSDFVTDKSNIVLESYPWVVDKTTHKYSEFWGLTWYGVSEDSILQGLKTAMTLTREQKDAMIKEAKKNVENFCSPESVLKKWQDIKLQIGI
jgi:glycosyltransferase involved in cell wall biosynthesis